MRQPMFRPPPVAAARPQAMPEPVSLKRSHLSAARTRSLAACALFAVLLSSAACRSTESRPARDAGARAVSAEAGARAETAGGAADPAAVGTEAGADADADGLPDRAELRAFDDRENFRRWFTGLAEAQFYETSGEWHAEQRDCAGLVRFALREALRRHDRNWFRRMNWTDDPPAPDVRAYTLERSPVGDKLFRTRPGAFRESDLSDGALSEFADARTLKEHNAEFLGRDSARAEPGDLLFFRQPQAARHPFHVMIFLGRARADGDDASDWVVYHTGSSPTDAGEVRKVRLADLSRHPDPRWRPVTPNRNFLGFYRLKILI
jgi:uncharacterized protein